MLLTKVAGPEGTSLSGWVEQKIRDEAEARGITWNESDVEQARAQRQASKYRARKPDPVADDIERMRGIDDAFGPRYS